MFYIDSANLLQEKISTDNMTTWTDGPLGDSKFEASEASTAMTAFYSGSWLGKTAGKSAGIRLYYGAPDNCIHELSFSLGSSSSWNAASTLDSNTNGNAGMTSDWLESNATAQLWTLDTSNELKLWYYIYNTTNQNDQTPANIAYGQWAEGSHPLPSIPKRSNMNTPRHLHRPRKRFHELVPNLRPRSPRLPATKLRCRSHTPPHSRPLRRRLLGRSRRQRYKQHRHRHDRRHARCRRVADRDGYGCQHERDVPLRLQPTERERYQPKPVVREYLGDGESDRQEGFAGLEYP